MVFLEQIESTYGYATIIEFGNIKLQSLSLSIR